MKTIWKYPLEGWGSQTIEMPLDAQILCVETQHGTPTLWALVDPNTSAIEQKTIRIFGTGQPFEDTPLSYIGTYQLHGGALIFHVFEQL